MPEVLNVFQGDAFSKVSLTEVMNRIPHKPGRIGSMGLFDRKGVGTPFVAIDEKDGRFQIIETSARGDDANRRRSDKRRVRRFDVPHLEERSRIYADDIIGTRLYGETPGVLTEPAKQQIVGERLEAMKADHEVTLEYHMMGALKGVTYDADGTDVIYNWFTEYGVTQNTETYGASLADVCRDLKRHMAQVLGSLSNNGQPVIHCFVGSDFMDKIANDATVKSDYQRYQDGQRLLDNAANTTFVYQGVVFEEYFGYFNASTPFVAANKGFAFPLGTNRFVCRDATPDTWNEVGTIGKPYYAEIVESMKYADVYTQSNPLCLCTQPAVLTEITLA